MSSSLPWTNAALLIEDQRPFPTQRSAADAANKRTAVVRFFTLSAVCRKEEDDIDRMEERVQYKLSRV